MRRYTLYYIMVCCCALLLCACGQQHNAERVVKDFMERNLKDPSSLTDVEFNDIDSTRHITNDVAATLRRQMAATAAQYKGDIDYGDAPQDGSLIMTSVRYTNGGKSYRDTYYMDRDITNVVAFKSTEQ